MGQRRGEVIHIIRLIDHGAPETEWKREERIGAPSYGSTQFVTIALQLIHDVPVDRAERVRICLLYTSPSPRDGLLSRMPSSA